MTTFTKIQNRRGAAALWTAKNPVLNDGEIGVESDTYRFKIGDGVTAWDALPYFLAPVSGANIKTVNNTSLLGAGDIHIPPGDGSVNASDYASVPAAVIAIGSNPKILNIASDSVVSTALIVPKTLTLKFVNGAKLVKSGSGTITFQGRGVDGDPVRPLFSGFALGDVKWMGETPTFRPEWFGAVGDGVTDDLAAFNQFWNVQGSPATQHVKILLSSGKTYNLSDTWEMDLPFTLEGEGEGDYQSPSATMQWPDDKRGIVIDALSTKTGINDGRSAAGSKIISVYVKGGGGFYGFTPTHTVDTSGLTVTKTTGEDFSSVNGYARGLSVTIDGFHYVMDSIVSPTQISLLKPRLFVQVPFGTNVVTAGDYNNTYPTVGAWNGQSVEIGGANYTIGTVTSHTVFNLTTPYSGPISNWYSSVVATAADTSTDRLTATAHGLSTGQVISFSSTTGTLPAPLTVRNLAANTGLYYVIVVDADTIKLATSYANALSSTAIDLTTSGSGTHSAQVGRYLGDASVQSLASMTGRPARANKYHGIHVKATAEIRNCVIQFWHGAGIALDSETGLTAIPGTAPNTNNSRIDRNTTNFTLGGGIWTKGINSNQIAILNNNLSNAYGGAGIFEASFLGNNYFGNHTSFNWFGATYGTGSANVSQFFGEYSEGGQPSTDLDQFMMMYGGNPGAGFDADNLGGYIRNNRGTTVTNSMQVNNSQSKTVAFALGGQKNSAFSLGAGENPDNIGNGGSLTDVRRFEYVLGYDQLATGWYDLYHGGQYTDHSKPLLAFSGNLSTEGPGKLWLPQGFYAGASAVRRQRFFVTSIPAGGTGAVGDIAENRVVDVTSPRGWIKTGASTWTPFNDPSVDTDILAGTSTTKFVNPLALTAIWAQGSDVASAATVTFGDGASFNVTGTATITAFAFTNDKTGRGAWVKFAGALTLTQNATSLILPTGANITTAAGDTCYIRSEGSGNFRVMHYQRASGNALAGGTAIGNAITGGGVNRVLYEDGSQNLAASANMTYGAATNQFLLKAGNATDVVFATQLAASPTGNAWNLLASDGTTVIASIDASGSFVNGDDSTGTSWSKISPQAGHSGFTVHNRTQSPVAAFSMVPTNVEALRLGGGYQIVWTPTDTTGTRDSGVGRVAPAVVKVTDGLTDLGWLQFSGSRRVSANVTNATATMTNVTDLSVFLQAGRKYSGTFIFIANNSTAAEGLAFDFNGGSATMTSVEFGFAATPPGSGLALGTLTSTALGTAITATTATTGDAIYTITFVCVVNAAGTLIPRIAEVSHTSGTATLKASSFMLLNDMP